MMTQKSKLYLQKMRDGDSEIEIDTDEYSEVLKKLHLNLDDLDCEIIAVKDGCHTCRLRSTCRNQGRCHHERDECLVFLGYWKIAHMPRIPVEGYYITIAADGEWWKTPDLWGGYEPDRPTTRKYWIYAFLNKSDGITRMVATKDKFNPRVDRILF